MRTDFMAGNGNVVIVDVLGAFLSPLPPRQVSPLYVHPRKFKGVFRSV